MNSRNKIEKKIKESRLFASSDLRRRNLKDMFEAYSKHRNEKVTQNPLLRVAKIAACLLLVAGGIFVFQIQQSPKTMMPAASSMAEFEAAVNRIKGAAQLLAAADMLAQQPGGREYARDRYHFVASQYPDLDSGLQANHKYQTLLKGAPNHD